MIKLNSENVQAIFDYCVSTEEIDVIDIDGIAHKFRFNKTKLNEKNKDIIDMLHQLPEQFMHDQGGGWSFLMACNNRNGERWTGLHLVMEQLFMLGMGCGVVEYLTPREMWQILPGGAPYLIIKE